MKKCFQRKCKSIELVNKEKLIFEIDKSYYVDIKGNIVSTEDFEIDNDDYYSEDPFESDWIEYEGLEEKLVSESVIEVTHEIDDIFGKYGFKNKAGEFVIEPQYAFAYDFTHGLAAVNLNRTWYKTEDGRRLYENHYGYINHLGKTVIPFMFDEAYPFNKYEVAVVDQVGKYGMLIDLDGNFIEGTENLVFDHYYDYKTRFLEFTYRTDEYDEDGPRGIYDTKERKILFEPPVPEFIEWDEEHILMYDNVSNSDGWDFYQYYINSKGERLYPWIPDRKFNLVEIPNKSLLAIVAVKNNITYPENPTGDYICNGKIYKQEYFYGVYSSDKKLELPLEYDEITEVTDNVFTCVKNGQVYVYRYEK